MKYKTEQTKFIVLKKKKSVLNRFFRHFSIIIRKHFYTPLFFFLCNFGIFKIANSICSNNDCIPYLNWCYDDFANKNKNDAETFEPK